MRYEAYIRKDWREVGQAYVVAARMRDNGRVELGALLLDLWCLGVRDAVFVDNYTDREFREALERHLPDDEREPLHPAMAKKLVEGAVEYAQKLGFAPHRDYRKACRVFNGIDAAACPETFSYGKDGKPMFISGESFSQERIARVLAMLEARCGKDGFHYVCQAEDLEADAGESAVEAGDEKDPLATRQALLDRLEEEPGAVPRFYEVSGLITGMQLCPQVIMPTKLVEVLWGPNGRHWGDAAGTKDFLALLMNYWNGVRNVVMTSVDSRFPEDEHPVDVWEEDFEDPRDLLVATFEWAIGFKRATTLWPEAWGKTLARPDLAPDWAVVHWWADFEKLRSPGDITAVIKTKPERTLNRAVTALARALRTPEPWPG